MALGRAANRRLGCSGPLRVARGWAQSGSASVLARAAGLVARLAGLPHRAQQQAASAASRWDRRAQAPSSIPAPCAARRRRGRRRLVAQVVAGWVAAALALQALAPARVARSVAAQEWASAALAGQARSAPAPPPRATLRMSMRQCGARALASGRCASRRSLQRPMPKVSRIAGFSSFSLSTTWQIEQSLLIALPAAFLCSPSWQRKQPSWLDSDGYAPHESLRSG